MRVVVFMQTIADIASNFSMVLILFCGLFVTIRLRGFQFRHFITSLREVCKGLIKKNKKSGISSFGAVATALAGTIGVGNIAGVCTAIAAGGAGALFWIWVAAFFGMALKFSEIVLAVLFRVKKEGKLRAGPMFYIERGLNSRKGAMLFSVLAMVASFGIGNLAQSNTAAVIIAESFGVDIIFVGFFLTLIVCFLLFGGVSRIVSINCVVVPIISFIYIISCLYIIFINIEKLPSVIDRVLYEAFSFRGGFGGTAFLAVRYGVSRGVFSNEAGLGSSPIIHGVAECKSAIRQGLWGIFEVFFDTILICSLTAFAIMLSGGFRGEATGIIAANNGFVLVFGDMGGYLLAFSMVFFALSSIAGWSVYGERAAEYIGGARAALLYKWVFAGFILFGSILDVSKVFMISDILNAAMATVNLVAVILLIGLVVDETKKDGDKW